MENKYLDSFTGLYNKQYLIDEFQNYYDKHNCFYMILMDLQNFKKINDEFGHEQGDVCLKVFSKLLKEEFENDGIVVHRSGDEFIVLTSFLFKEIKQKLESIKEKITEKFSYYNLVVPFSFNAGICGNIGDLNTMLLYSDLTMYETKKKKELYAEFSSEVIEKYNYQKIQLEYVDNLIKDELFLYPKQKIYTLDRTPVFSEIYVRTPLKTPILKDNNYVLLRERFRLAKIDLLNFNQIADLELPNIINIDALTLNCCYLDILERIEQMESHNFGININLNYQIQDIQELKQILIKLHSLGVFISVEGLKNLEAVSLLPVVADVPISYIKIDKSFLQKAMKAERYKILLKHFIDTCNDCGTCPIFSQVETEYEADFIEKIAPNALVKGYFYSQEQY